MDLSVIKPTERNIEVKHPGTGEPIGVRISLISMDDDRMKKLRRSLTDQAQKAAQKGKALLADDLEANSNLILWTAATRWHWYNPTGKEGDEGYEADAMPDFHGEVPEFTQKNFMAMITELVWIKRQLTEELDELKDFFANSATI